MDFLNLETEQFDLIISYESQKVEKLKCKMNDKIEDILNEFATKVNADFSQFLILYGGKTLDDKDLKNTFFQTMSDQEKKEKTMNILIYTKSPNLISGNNFITIILIINSRNIRELKGKKDETIKDIFNRNNSKIGYNIKSLVFKYGITEIDLNKKFDEIANDTDKRFSGMTLSAYTIAPSYPLTVNFIYKYEDPKVPIYCNSGDKIKEVFNKYCLKTGKNINKFSFKYEMIDIDLNITFNEYFEIIENSKRTDANLPLDKIGTNTKYDEIDVIVIDRISFFKNHKKLIIIISVFILILIIALIIYLLFRKKEPEIPDELSDSTEKNEDLSTIIKTENQDTTIVTYKSQNLINETHNIITTDINTYKSEDLINETNNIINTVIITDKPYYTINETEKLSNSIRIAKICDSGYFIPNDDLTFEDCQKCSIVGCIKCNGTYENNECTNCGNLTAIYDKNSNKIVSCNKTCETGEEEKCLECLEDKIECKNCNIGYKLVEGKCRPDFLIKAIYKSIGEGDVVDLFNSWYSTHVSQMIIDGETMGSKFQFQFPNEGNHTVYIKFRKDTNPEMYSTSQFFSNKEKLLSVVFSDFDEYLPDLCFDSLFSGCKNLISVDLSKIAVNSKSKMGNMFSNCVNLVYVNFNLKKYFIAEQAQNMFFNCKSLTSINLSKLNISLVTSLSEMFAGCNSLKSININNFKLSSATSINSMFMNCYSLEYIDLSSFRPSKLTNMGSAFYNCKSLKSINLNNFYTSNVINMEHLFFNCTSLTIINLTSFNTEDVQNMKGIFENCFSLTSIIFGNNFFTKEVTIMDSFFAHCHSLETINYPLIITNINNLTAFFSDCYSLTFVNFNNFDTSRVNRFNYMFRNCYSLNNINISKFKFTNNADTRYMFAGCYSLTSLNFDNFESISLTYDGMFFNCPNLKYLNLSFVSSSGSYSSFFNGNISSNGTLILSARLFQDKEKYLKIPADWLVYKI